MEGKITGFIGLLLLAGFTLLIVWKVPSPPLLIVIGVVLLMAAWHWIEEEWLSRS